MLRARLEQPLLELNQTAPAGCVAANKDAHAGEPTSRAMSSSDEPEFANGLGDLLNMEQRATETALNEAGRLTTTITVPAVDEAAIGALFHLFEVQTLVAGALLGIDPLDQPGVEAGKRLTYAMAGRPDLAEVARTVRERFDARDADLILG